MRARERRGATLVPRHGLVALAMLFALLVGAAPARASYEEFLTLNVGKLEEDDESLLDHVLVRQPREWRDAWEQSPSGFRSSQGCFTSGKWFLDHDLHVRVPMGDTSTLTIEMREVSDDEASYDWTRFDLRFPVSHVGTLGLRLSPTFDKSRHDAALTWEHGRPDSGFTVRAVMGLEDVFNKFWSSRQVRVGDESEPYERHPYEPELRFGWRSASTRAALGGKWQTPSIKFIDTHDPALHRRVHLWGVKYDASLAQRFGAHTAEIGFESVQASQYQFWDVEPGDHHTYGRRSRGEAAYTRWIGEQGRVTLRYVYQQRTQVWRPPIANHLLDVIDRMPWAEAGFRTPANSYTRVGFMRDRVTVSGIPWQPVYTEGTRLETRAYVALQLRFGRVQVEGIECIELNREPYDVAFIHDKGFLHFQTTF